MNNLSLFILFFFFWIYLAFDGYIPAFILMGFANQTLFMTVIFFFLKKKEKLE